MMMNFQMVQESMRVAQNEVKLKGMPAIAPDGYHPVVEPHGEGLRLRNTDTGRVQGRLG